MKFKHTLLALGAAAALGAAGSAHAVTYVGYPGGGLHKATGLEVRESGSGTMLVVPYFNAQKETKTAMHVRTGSLSTIVRVHVRSAANGDILKSFTLMLAPNDTWTAEIVSEAGAAPRIYSRHPACVFTGGNGASGKLDEPLELDNLAPYISQAAKIQHAGEGYVEFISMADVGFGYAADNDIKKRNCGALNALVRDYEPTAEADVTALGLWSSNSFLSGIWYLINQDAWTAYSGRMIAIGPKHPETAQIRFFPQRTTAEVVAGGNTGEQTTLAFMTLATAASPSTVAMETGGWSALPDLSTPVSDAFATPQKQITAIGKVLYGAANNDFVSDPSGSASGGTPMFTDWVMSNPLQRYYAGVEYGKSAAEAKVVTTDYGSDKRYAWSGTLKNTGAMGPAVCGHASLGLYSREGKETPAPQLEPCGAVWTLGFDKTSPMFASVGRIVQTPPSVDGSAIVGYVTGNAPILFGFAAFSAKNGATRVSYPTTWPHARSQ